jgi:hypothetical protein
MRFIILAAAAVLVLALLTPAPSVAQTTKGSLSESFNACVSLARERGWTDSDLDGNRAGARNFVINCMRGSKSRAQKQSRPQKR